MKKLILVGIGLAGAAAFIGFDAVEAFVDHTRSHVRSHLMSPEMELQKQLAEAKRLSHSCVESIQQGEMSLAKLDTLIEERERDLAYRNRQLAFQRTVLEARKGLLDSGLQRIEIRGELYNRGEVNRDAVLRAKTYSSNRDICQQLEETLMALKMQRDQTSHEIKEAATEQKRLENDVAVLKAELENLQARKAVAQTRSEAEYVFDRSTFDQARDKIAEIRATIAVQNRQLDLYGRSGRVSGGLIPAEDSFEAEVQDEDGAHAIASVLKDEQADDEDADEDRPLEAAIRR
ncbi:MAG: hypothetical protein ACYTGN_12010 [Planctomycetota bacterium]|jgi:phage shock protein A